MVNKKIDGISKGSHDEDKKRKSESKRKHKPKYACVATHINAFRTKDKDKDVPLEVLCVWGEDKRLIKATKATPLDLLVQIIKVSAWTTNSTHPNVGRVRYIPYSDQIQERNLGRVYNHHKRCR